MTELMRILYDYASRCQLSGSMEDCKQFQASTVMMEKNLKRLRELLDDEGIRRLENYQGEMNMIHDLEMEAIFCAGFSIGQELSRQ